jgi:hypothetical protein
MTLKLLTAWREFISFPELKNEEALVDLIDEEIEMEEKRQENLKKEEPKAQGGSGGKGGDGGVVGSTCVKCGMFGGAHLMACPNVERQGALKKPTWHVYSIFVLAKDEIKNALDDGWEPFAVSDEMIYFRRLKT